MDRHVLYIRRRDPRLFFLCLHRPIGRCLYYALPKQRVDFLQRLLLGFWEEEIYHGKGNAKVYVRSTGQLWKTTLGAPNRQLTPRHKDKIEFPLDLAQSDGRHLIPKCANCPVSKGDSKSIALPTDLHRHDLGHIDPVQQSVFQTHLKLLGGSK